MPAPGEYGVGMVFLPVDPQERMLCEGILEKVAREEGLTVLGWRDTPINGNTIGRLARSTQPYIEQIFIRRGRDMDQDALERKLYVVRKRAEKRSRNRISRKRTSSTSRPFLRGRSFTRDCCSRRRSRIFIRNWPIRK